MTRINTNVSSLVAQNRLNRTNADLQTSLTRLSTGLRINTGKDDPAGLIASEALRSDITSINKAISNTRRATQIIATADSALGQVSSLLNDIRGLVVEAANTGALSEDEIAANQLQVDSSLKAINRIAQTTTFQGRKLLDGSLNFNTTAGTNFTSLTNIQINQANLGSAGSFNLNIEVSSAATRAEIAVANIPATGSAGEGTITLANSTPENEAATGSLSTAAVGTDFSFAIKDGTDLDGVVGNDVTVNITSGATAVLDNAESTTLTAGTGGTVGEYSIAIKEGTAYDGFAGNNVQFKVESGNAATAQAVSESQDAGGVTDAFTVSAKVDGALDGAAGNGVTIDIATAAGAAHVFTYNAGTDTLEIEVANDRDYTYEEIAEALAADGIVGDYVEFNFAPNGQNAVYATGTNQSFALDGATLGTDAAAKAEIDFSDIDAPVLTVTVNDNQDETLSAIKAALDADSTFNDYFVFNHGTNGTFRSNTVPGTDDNVAVTNFSGGSNEVVAASFADNVLNVTVNNVNDQNLSDIKTAFDAITAVSDLFDLTVATDGAFKGDASDNIVGAAFAGGTSTTNSSEVITVTGPNGDASNGTISIARSADVTAPEAAVDTDGNITVTISDTIDTRFTEVVDAINGLNGYIAEITTTDTSGLDGLIQAGDVVSTTDIAGATGGGLTNDVIFELGGANGAQVFQIAAGTTLDQLISQINLVAEATGVQAEADGDSLLLQSAEYGSDEFVDLRIIEEEDAGNFTSTVGVRARETGSDVVSKINGVDASGDGNALRVNNSTLDIALSVDAGFSGSIEFTITGGGATFQLGPEVVSNQQARIGINSLNTAQLGGVAGRLYQLAEGGTAALVENTTLASEIVDAAINQVTGLRGRLGAFQATALESNLVSLNETVNNLTEAESSIRDADFAAESARLTRNQILIQSGTNVLALANQNPQNVLSLLR